MALIDVGIVNVALPSIQHGLGATPSELQWVLSGYALTFGAALIAAGRAGDIFGRGGVSLAGFLVFTGASLGGPHWGWRLTFLVNVPLGIEGVVLSCVWFLKPLLRWRSEAPETGPAPATGLLAALDSVGSMIAALAVWAVLFPFVEFHTFLWAG